MLGLFFGFLNDVTKCNRDLPLKLSIKLLPNPFGSDTSLLFNAKPNRQPPVGNSVELEVAFWIHSEECNQQHRLLAFVVAVCKHL